MARERILSMYLSMEQGQDTKGMSTAYLLLDDDGTDQRVARLDELSFQCTFGEVWQMEWSQGWRSFRVITIA